MRCSLRRVWKTGGGDALEGTLSCFAVAVGDDCIQAVLNDCLHRH